ncbi:MAG: XRE family transcriptional regulator [Shinella sp.]|nr:XRE family transcriptional regulator [Shinella sp.]
MLEKWEKNFRERLQASGLNMKAVSLKAGLGETFVRDMLERGRVPSIDKFQRLAKVLGTTVADLLDEGIEISSSVPLVGYIGAGAEVLPEFEQVPPEGLDQLEIPFGLPAEMLALEVRGDSMLPVYRDGTAIIVYREQKKPLDAFYGQDAAVRTTDGRRYLKTIMRGHGNSVNLLSWNAAPIENVRLSWIGEIFATLPRSSRR